MISSEKRGNTAIEEAPMDGQAKVTLQVGPPAPRPEATLNCT